MKEDWQDATKEKFESRINFITELFPKWKKAFCQEMGQWDGRFLNLEDKIEWRKDKSGTIYSPTFVCSLYFDHYRYKAKFLMTDPNENLDRHKIVAITQRLILEHYPFTYSGEVPFDRKKESPPKEVRVLNVSFAYHFALEFLRTWNKGIHENKQDKSFDSNSLFKCLESTDFVREHFKFLTLDLEGTFPTVLIAQLWFALEQWGLSHMRETSKLPKQPV